MRLKNELLEQKNNLIAYLLQKVKYSDWHAVADAAMDLREVDAKIDLLMQIEVDAQAVASTVDEEWARRLGRD